MPCHQVILSIALEIEILSTEVQECDEVVEVCQEEIHHLSASSLFSTASTETECYVETSNHVENIENIEHGFAYLSIAILSLFLLENMLLIIAKP